MKNAFTILGALVVALAAVAAVAVFIKKYTVNLTITKNEPDEDFTDDDFYGFEDDVNWEEVPVEDEFENDILSENLPELDSLDGDANI